MNGRRSINDHKMVYVLLFIVFLLNNCSQFGGNELFFECKSPNGRMVATFYRVYGGGAAGYQESRINIREVGTHLNMDKYFFSMSHGYDVKITWLNNKLLKVEYPKYSDIHKAKGRVFGSNQAYNKDVVIKILYTGIDSNFGRFINGSSGCRVINRPE